MVDVVKTDMTSYKMATSMAQHDYGGHTMNSQDVAFPVLEIAKQMIQENRESSTKNTRLSGERAVTCEREDAHRPNMSNRINENTTVVSDTEPLNENFSSGSIDLQGREHTSNQAYNGEHVSLINTDNGLLQDPYVNQTYIPTAALMECRNKNQPVMHTVSEGPNTQLLYSINCFQQPNSSMNYEQFKHTQQCYPVYAHDYQQVAQEQIVNCSNQSVQSQQFDQNILPTGNSLEPMHCVANGMCVETQGILNPEDVLVVNLETETPPVPQAWSQGTPLVSPKVDESEILQEIKQRLKGSNLVKKVTIDAHETETPPQDVNLAPPCFYKNVPPPTIASGTTACTNLVHVANAAVATKPCGDKVIIPLDQNMYEVKIKGSDLDDMPGDAVENAFKKESELYGSQVSPRPIQTRGSISDEDLSEVDDYATDASTSAESLSEKVAVVCLPDKNVADSENRTASVEQEKDNVDETTAHSSDNNEKLLVTTEPEEQDREITAQPETTVTVIETPTRTESVTVDENRLSDDASEGRECTEQVNSVAETETVEYTKQMHSVAETPTVEYTKQVKCVAEKTPTIPVDIGQTAEITGNAATVTTAETTTAQETPNDTAAMHTDTSEVCGQAIDTVVGTNTNPYPQMAPDQQILASMQPYQENTAWGESGSAQPALWYTQNEDGTWDAQQPFENPIGECYQFNNLWYQHTFTEPTSGDVTNFDESSQFVTDPLVGLQNPQQQIQDEVTNHQQFPVLHVSEDGLVTVLLKHGVCLEMTTDKALRLVCHERKLVAAMTADGSSACLIHPAAKVYQNSTTTDVDLYLARKVKIMTENTVFGNNFNTYSFDYSMINQCDGFAEFIDQSEDKSVDFLETDSGFVNFDVTLRTSEIVSRAYFEKYGREGCKVIINGVKVTQNHGGEVSVSCGPIKFLRLSPLKSILRLRSQFLEADIETNWNVKLRRGTHSLNASYLGLIISNGKIKACIDQKNKLQAYGLPDHRRIYLGQRLPQPRPGVPRQRYINLPQRQGEPEGDHWGYTRQPNRW